MTEYKEKLLKIVNINRFYTSLFETMIKVDDKEDLKTFTEVTYQAIKEVMKEE